VSEQTVLGSASSLKLVCHFSAACRRSGWFRHMMAMWMDGIGWWKNGLRITEASGYIVLFVDGLGEDDSKVLTQGCRR